MSQDLAITLQSIKVYNDNDGAFKGAGEIYINWSASDGVNGDDGKLGNYSIHSGQTKGISQHLATFNDVEDQIALTFNVKELTGALTIFSEALMRTTVRPRTTELAAIRC